MGRKLARMFDQQEREKPRAEFRGLKFYIIRFVKTDNIEQLALEHLETLKQCQKPATLMLSYKNQIDKVFREFFDLSWLKWNFNKIKVGIKKFLRKF